MGMNETALAALRGRAIEEGMDAPAFQALLFDALAKGRAADEEARATERTTPRFLPRPVSQFGHSWEDPAVVSDRRARAIAARALGIKPGDDAREFMNARLVDHAREMLLASGVRLPRYASDAATIERALTMDDFPGLLKSVADRSLHQLVAADSPVRVLCRPREVRDFRQIEAISFSGPGTLAEVREGGEVTHAPPAERREVGRVKTYARAVTITRRALVNDDLGAFGEPMRLFAAAVAEVEASEFIANFTPNGSGWGPTMSDGNPLFATVHGNTISGPISTTGIGVARQTMRGQQLPGGGLARVTPKFVLVSPANETEGEKVLSQTAIATDLADRPVFGGVLRLLVEPRLNGAPWFLAADPSEAACLELVTLSGTGGMPRVETYDAGPERLGVTMRVVHDFAVMPVGWVGWVRATGV
jgi:hypothetical protein